ncbi:MAG: autotransporter outer membrane beta-barrel domain-containing protein [Nitrospirales bacterium]
MSNMNDKQPSESSSSKRAFRFSTSFSRLIKITGKHGLLGTVLLAASLCFPTQTLAATTLDQAIANQLDLQCQNLTGGGAVAGLGSNLTALCNDIPSGPGGSAGGGTGSAQSLGATVENRRNDRLEGNSTGNQATFNLPSGLGIFVLGNFEALNRDRTTFGDGFDSTVLGATAGADYRFNEMFLAGGAFNYVNRDGDFDGGGNFNTDSYGGIVYGSVMPIPALFMDVSLGYTRHNYDLKRQVQYVTLGGTPFGGNARSDSDGNEFLIQALTGYDHSIGNITIGPRVGVNYSRLSIDDYKENGGGGIGLEYDDQTVKSLQTTVGVQGSMAINTSYGVWVPQATADYVHEFENDRRSIDVQFIEDNRANPTKFSFNNDKPDRNFFNLGIGTVLVLPNGIQPFVNFKALVGHSQFDNYAGTIGVRIEGS